MTGYFGGRLISQQSHDGITLSEVRYDQPRRCPSHSHGRAFFSLLLRGRYASASRGHRLAPRLFDLGFQPAGVEHSDDVEVSGTRFFLVELSAEWLGRLLEFAPETVLEPRLCGAREAILAARLYRDHRHPIPGSPLRMEGAALELLAGLSDGPDRLLRKRPSWLDTVIGILDSDFDRRSTLTRAAREVGLNPVYVSRTFRRFVGQSPGEYRTRSRIRFALEKLGCPEIPLADVAFLSGFSDQSHFTRVFKSHTGMTPGSFRAVALRTKRGAV